MIVEILVIAALAILIASGAMMEARQAHVRADKLYDTLLDYVTVNDLTSSLNLHKIRADQLEANFVFMIKSFEKLEQANIDRHKAETDKYLELEKLFLNSNRQIVATVKPKAKRPKRNVVRDGNKK